MSTDSRVQSMTLAILLMITSPLSIAGSTLILRILAANWKQRQIGPLQRILIGLCTCDIIGSLGLMASVFPSPVGTRDIIWASGNTFSCTSQGLFLHFGTSVVHYNALLSIYYLVMVRYDVSEKVFQRRIERFAHLLIILNSLISGILSVVNNWFNNIGTICYIGPYPKGCNLNDEIDCERGENAFMMMWLLSGIFVTLSYISLFFSSFALVWTVWQQERTMERKYKFNNTTIVAEASPPGDRHQFTRTKKVRNQALCYVAASFICMSWVLLARSFKGKPPFPLRCLANFFYPLQGFFNYINYIRPRVARLRRSDLAKSWLHGAYLVTFVSDVNLKQRKAQRQTRRSPNPQFENGI